MESVSQAFRSVVVSNKNVYCNSSVFMHFKSAGYSWLTNQHGLTIDTIEAYELVLPNGTVTTITSSNSDLFFALKVGCDYTLKAIL